RATPGQHAVADRLIGLSSSAQSATVRAMEPTWSSVGASGMTPVIGTLLKDGLIAAMPHNDAGMRTEPAVSVPSAAGVMPAAIAAADPPLDPPADLARAPGVPT